MNENEKALLFARAGKDLNDEDLITAKAELDASVEAIIMAESQKGLNELLNEPYDAELPMQDVVNEIAKVSSIAQGVTAQYYVQDVTAKAIYTIVNGSVTQTNFTPGLPSTLSIGFYDGAQDYIYVPDMLAQKYNAIALKAKAQMEAFNRKENKDVIDLVIASAVSESNTFHNDSGVSAITYKKLVEMVRSMAKYGNKLVLVSGSTVSTDLMLMDYTEDKNRAVSVESAGISKWIKLEDKKYTHSTEQTVIEIDKAVLVATSDAEDNRPVEFVRQRTNALTGSLSVEKERVIISEGPKIHVGALPKLAYSLVTFGAYGAVVTGPKCCAVFKSDTSYS
ncbi:MAG: hypothetical protein J7L15_03465 [Clostridiales bacterium]|nr:hypothetical protein [Clostridiales bacterium]